MPPPASRQQETRGQWSRPASLFTCGDRPNSPHTTTGLARFVARRRARKREASTGSLLVQRHVLYRAKPWITYEISSYNLEPQDWSRSELKNDGSHGPDVDWLRFFFRHTLPDRLELRVLLETVSHTPLTPVHLSKGLELVPHHPHHLTEEF